MFNLKIWSLYLDFEKNLGSLDSIKNAYKKCIDLKVASPFILITYANFLEENKFYEEQFKVFETGLTLYTWPTLYDIWILYLSKFV